MKFVEYYCQCFEYQTNNNLNKISTVIFVLLKLVKFGVAMPNDFTMQGGPLMLNDENNTFQFLQLHFHWGSTEDQGSEHTVEGRR